MALGLLAVAARLPRVGAGRGELRRDADPRHDGGAVAPRAGGAGYVPAECRGGREASRSTRGPGPGARRGGGGGVRAGPAARRGRKVGGRHDVAFLDHPEDLIDQELAGAADGAATVGDREALAAAARPAARWRSSSRAGLGAAAASEDEPESYATSRHWPLRRRCWHGRADPITRARRVGRRAVGCMMGKPVGRYRARAPQILDATGAGRYRLLHRGGPAGRGAPMAVEPAQRADQPRENIAGCRRRRPQIAADRAAVLEAHARLHRAPNVAQAWLLCPAVGSSRRRVAYRHLLDGMVRGYDRHTPVREGSGTDPPRVTAGLAAAGRRAPAHRDAEVSTCAAAARGDGVAAMTSRRCRVRLDTVIDAAIGDPSRTGSPGGPRGRELGGRRRLGVRRRRELRAARPPALVPGETRRAGRRGARLRQATSTARSAVVAVAGNRLEPATVGSIAGASARGVPASGPPLKGRLASRRRFDGPGAPTWPRDAWWWRLRPGHRSRQRNMTWSSPPDPPAARGRPCGRRVSPR